MIQSQDRDKRTGILSLSSFEKHYKMVSNYELYGYCFMDNHVHILVKETTETISLVIKLISGSYVYWYNWTTPAKETKKG